MESDLVDEASTSKELWKKLAELEKAVYNICWRLDKIEKEHEHARLE